MDEVEVRTIAKVTRRLVPFLIVCYFVAYLDRVNVGFAALTMNQDLGLSQTAFGFGAGIFFIAYFIFEVPSNLLLERFGARKWIARIMLSWGILSGTMAFIPASPRHRAGQRARLLPASRAAGRGRGRLLSRHHLLPDALVSGSVPGAHRRLLHGRNSALHSDRRADLRSLLVFAWRARSAGWQWLFIIEAVPASSSSVVVFFYLTDRPADAAWLAPDERDWLAGRLEVEQRQRETVRDFTVRQAMVNPRVLGLSLVYFGAVATNYGLSFFLPQIVKTFGSTPC